VDSAMADAGLAGDGAPAEPPTSDAGSLRDDSGTSAAEPVIDHAEWRTYDAALDPLASHQPSPLECGLGGTYPDPLHHLLDVETAFCNYVLLEHPALVDIAVGDELNLRFYYFDLVASEPAEAHLALLLDDTVAWQTHVPIPSSADAVDVRFPAPRALSVGEPLRWHLHNHGQNSWVLTAVTRTRR